MPESAYLLHAGSDRVGALDVRPDLQSAATPGVDGVKSLQYLIEAADRIEAGLPVIVCRRAQENSLVGAPESAESAINEPVG